MQAREAYRLLRLEEEGVKGFKEWFLKEVTANLAQECREVGSSQMQAHGPRQEPQWAWRRSK